MKRLNILLKLCLAFLLVHAVYFSDLPQYKNKAIALRVIFYPLAALLTGIIWSLYGKRRSKKYPHFIDICLTFVVAFDLLGNTLALYDKITWWDDIMHLFLSIPWVLVAGYLLVRTKLAPKVAAGLVIAYGSTSHIVWELLEYQSFLRSHPTESITAYQDTMGDLALALVGTLIGAGLTFAYMSARRRR